MNSEIATSTAMDIIIGAGGLGILGVALRAVVTWMGRQGMISAGDSSQKDLIDRLNSEAKKWEDRYNKLMSHHDEYIELIHQLRIQNRMMRQMLIDRGALPEVVDKMIYEAIEMPNESRKKSKVIHEPKE